MAKIRKIYDRTIKPDGTKTTIYPITSTRAVYTPNAVTVDTLLNEGYRFGGLLSPGTIETPNQRMFYCANTAGNYVFAGQTITLIDQESAFLLCDTTHWIKVNFGGSSGLVGVTADVIENGGDISVVPSLHDDGTMTLTFYNIKGDTGETGQDGTDGEDGLSIGSITKLSQSGNDITYAVKLTDDTQVGTFTVTNGTNGTNGINGINGQDGQDGRDGIDGVGISSITGPVTVGNVDTYTITLTNGNSSTFTVTNGTNGAAATIAVGSCSVGQPGTTPSVVNVGTADAAVFNFVIPQGAKGETGSGLNIRGTEPDTTAIAAHSSTAQVGEAYNCTADNLIYIYDGTSTTSAIPGWFTMSTAGYQKPVGGIPSSDLASAVQTSLGKADNAVQPTDLATVATSGSYNDLSNKPIIPAAQVNADWNSVSGVSQILNKPTIPAAQVNADWSASSGVAEILHKPSLGTAAAKNVPASGNASTTEVVMGDDSRLTDSRNAADVYSWAKASTKPSYSYSEISNTPSLAAVATSGSYNDLSNKPTIPDAQIQSDWNQTTNTAKDYIKNKPTIPTIMTGATAGSAGTSGTVPTPAAGDQNKYLKGDGTWSDVNTPVVTTQPAGGMLPNIMYSLGTITTNTTFSMASAPNNNIVNHWFWTFDTSSTAPTITWPAGINWLGSGTTAPTIATNKYYQISVLDNIGICMEV